MKLGLRTGDNMLIMHAILFPTLHGNCGCYGNENSHENMDPEIIQ